MRIHISLSDENFQWLHWMAGDRTLSATVAEFIDERRRQLVPRLENPPEGIYCSAQGVSYRVRQEDKQ